MFCLFRKPLPAEHLGRVGRIRPVEPHPDTGGGEAGVHQVREVPGRVNPVGDVLAAAFTSGEEAHVPVNVFAYCHALRAENRADAVRGIIGMLEFAGLSHMLRPGAGEGIHSGVASQRSDAVLGTPGINAGMDIRFLLGGGLLRGTGRITRIIWLLRLLWLSGLSRLSVSGAAGNHLHDLRIPDATA